MAITDQNILDRLHKAREAKIKKPSDPPAKVNEKRAVVNKVYEKARKLYLSTHFVCEAHLENCTKEATEIHHQAGKASEELLVNPDYFLAVCRRCHREIEENPAQAIASGLSVPRLSK